MKDMNEQTWGSGLLLIAAAVFDEALFGGSPA